MGLVADCRATEAAEELELESSLNAYQDMKCVFLAYEGKRLLGVLSLFAPRKDEAEISALVRPDARRTGVFRVLLNEAERELTLFSYSRELFVVDSRSSAGTAVATGLGAQYDFTEYSLRYAGSCPESPSLGLSVSRVGIECLDALVDLRTGEFGDSRDETENFERATFASKDRQVYAAFLDGKLVAACSLGFSGGTVSINGLVTKKELRGRGYGQAFLSRVVRLLEAQNLKMTLDVESQNANAYHLYKKMGFVEERAVEYYRRPLPAGIPGPD